MLQPKYLSRASRAILPQLSKGLERGFSAGLRATIRIAEVYLRLEVDGLEYIPRSGPCIVTPNHSGCAGFDAAILSHLLYRHVGRVPRMLTLWTLFRSLPPLGRIATGMGCIPASFEAGERALRRSKLVLLFPEGERGSFKPSREAYRLQTFHSGFVRLAQATGAPIIPCVVTGAEETHVNLGTVRFKRMLPGFLAPVPFNLVPFPAKWRIRFLPPVSLADLGAADDSTPDALAEALRRHMQEALNQCKDSRPYVFWR